MSLISVGISIIIARNLDNRYFKLYNKTFNAYFNFFFNVNISINFFLDFFFSFLCTSEYQSCTLKCYVNISHTEFSFYQKLKQFTEIALSFRNKVHSSTRVEYFVLRLHQYSVFYLLFCIYTVYTIEINLLKLKKKSIL